MPRTTRPTPRFAVGDRVRVAFPAQTADGGGVYFGAPVTGIVIQTPRGMGDTWTNPRDYRVERIDPIPPDVAEWDWNVRQYVGEAFLSPFGVSLVHPDRLPWCTHCGDERVPSIDRTGCDHCEELCARCNTFAPTVHMEDVRTSDYGDRTVLYCRPCRRNHTLHCAHCDALTESDVMSRCGTCGRICGQCSDNQSYCDYCDEYYCGNGSSHEDCGDDDDSDYYSSGSSGGIRNYSYRPSLNFRGEGRVHLGMEIEIDAPARLADEIGHTDLIYCKEDGSVPRGFEIVTHPMTYEWALTEFPWERIRHLAANGGSPSYHGMHVHIARAAFDGQEHTYRWLRFIYGNETEMVSFVRRRSDRWASFNDRDSCRDKARGGRSFERYMAVNAQNSQTFEVRLFASTLTVQEIQAALGLVSGVCEWTRTLPDSAGDDGSLTWQAFADWAAARPIYAPVVAEMTRTTGVVPAPAVTVSLAHPARV